MTLTIAKLFLPEGHQCARLHGHNYEVEVILSGPPDASGFVLDYGELAPIKHFLDGVLDHHHLNEVMGSPDGRLTTAEALAAFLLGRFLPTFPALVAVRVSETPKTWAEARV
jgi:6-pyruvoyltetrahydropterin/6-carboxytetrahydropterin synthase